MATVEEVIKKLSELKEIYGPQTKVFFISEESDEEIETDSIYYDEIDEAIMMW